MTHLSPTSDDSPPPQTLAEMLEELIDLSTGLGVALLPLLVLSLPAIVLFVLLPAILLLALAAPLAVIGAVLAAPPCLLARRLRRD
jgi:Flp pilus assembly protein TadB